MFKSFFILEFEMSIFMKPKIEPVFFNRKKQKGEE